LTEYTNNATFSTDVTLKWEEYIVDHKHRRKIVTKVMRALDLNSPLNEREIRKNLKRLKINMLRDIAKVILSLGKRKKRRTKTIKRKKKR